MAEPCPLLIFEPLSQEGVLCAITTRTASDKDGNFSFYVTSDHDAVRANRRAACLALGSNIADLIVPQMTHSANVAAVGDAHRGAGAIAPNAVLPDCDALITNTPGVLLGITVADCLPVFLVDMARRAVGIAHSGWRGTAGGIVARTLQLMTDTFGTEVRDVQAVIGPGIGPEGYEVDAQVREGFAPEIAEAPGVFAFSWEGHWHLDLAAAVSHQLRNWGVPEENITRCPYHTNTHSELLYSHRASPGCPRMMAFLGLKTD